MTHKKLPEVKQLLDDERRGKNLKNDRVKAFNDFKREGIRKHKQCRIAENSDDLIGERLCTGQKVMCSGCSGFFKKENFYRHRKNCVLSSRAVGVDHAASLPSPDDEVWQGVMSGMRRDATLLQIC